MKNKRNKKRSYTAPKLPPELWEYVCDHLQRPDLTQLRGVNHFFLEFTKPFFYRFGTFTKLGLYFPHAPTKYPAINLPELGNHAFQQNEWKELESVIRRVELPLHTTGECQAFWDLTTDRHRHGLGELDVMYIELHRCLTHEEQSGTLPGASNHVRRDGRCVEAPDSDVEDEDDVQVDDKPLVGCRGVCHMYESYSLWAEPRKLVVRNASLRWGNPYDHQADPPEFPWDPASEFVFVLNSGDTWSWLDEAHDNGPRQFDCELIPHWGIRPRPGPNAREATVVFWQPDPESFWIPPCGHFLGYCRNGFPTSSKCKVVSMVFEEFAEQVAASDLERITFVGAERICALDYGGNLISDGRNPELACIPVDDIEEHFLRMGIQRSREIGQSWDREVEFVSFSDWVATGAWEDVFKRKEIKPWLKD